MADDRPGPGPRRRPAIAGRTRAACAAAGILAAGVLTGVAAGPADATPISGSPFRCTYVVLNSWFGGFSADLHIRNDGPPIYSWSVRMVFPMASSNLQAWSARMTQPTPYEMTAENMTWNGNIGTGLETTFGWSARSAGVDVPSEITVNGLPC